MSKVNVGNNENGYCILPLDRNKVQAKQVIGTSLSKKKVLYQAIKASTDAFAFVSHRARTKNIPGFRGNGRLGSFFRIG